MAGNFVVGVDIGGTKTQLVVARDGITLADRTDATGSWRRHRLDEDAAALVAMVRDAAGGAEPAAIVVGAHGCDSTEQCQVFQELIAARTGGAVLVLNDSELLLPAAGQAMGISVIAGTGSIAVARLPDGSMLTAGGWGWFLGDEGSASGLVRDAARAVRDALDRGQALDPLAQALLGILDIDDPVRIGKTLAAEGSAAGIGRHAPALFAAAEGGSELARSVIEAGGQALALLVRRLVDRGAKGGCVVAGGGVITRQPRLMRAFEVAVAEQVPGWTVTLLATPPAFGAIRLAESLLRGDVPPQLPRPAIPAPVLPDSDRRMR
ncbi:BadF/BadG/BcrA/BcrD ATPase family protein [Mycobacterium sp. KBS0706]|uniref:BadF/BadG/BcrA/BcrD ATPase family protein n=1 Tax=Mycobacterium sp. KBS0706 TaxID=2578109 RepID=UPI001C8F90E8|nr:BadF/BadG/BcrA/BcrD ATPase family protein [Mycobacterium sp. KBS0706]